MNTIFTLGPPLPTFIIFEIIAITYLQLYICHQISEAEKREEEEEEGKKSLTFRQAPTPTEIDK